MQWNLLLPHIFGQRNRVLLTKCCVRGDTGPQKWEGMWWHMFTKHVRVTPQKRRASWLTQIWKEIVSRLCEIITLLLNSVPRTYMYECIYWNCYRINIVQYLDYLNPLVLQFWLRVINTENIFWYKVKISTATGGHTIYDEMGTLWITHESPLPWTRPQKWRTQHGRSTDASGHLC